MVKARWARLTALVVIVGMPVLLVKAGGSPLPLHIPSGTQVHTWLSNPLKHQYVTTGIRSLMWMLWAVIIGTWLLLVVSVSSRGRAILSYRLPRRVRRFAAALRGAGGEPPRREELVRAAPVTRQPTRIPSHGDALVELVPGGFLSIGLASGALVAESDASVGFPSFGDPTDGDEQIPPTALTAGWAIGGLGHLAFSYGVGLTGPGAFDAARSLLVASLTTAATDNSRARVQVITTSAAIEGLLGRRVAGPARHSRLVVARNIEAAMTTLDEEIIHRARVLADNEDNEVAGLDEGVSGVTPFAHLLFVGQAPGPEHEHRLASVIRLGEATTGAVLIGEWVYGTTLAVSTDGTVTGGDISGRVAVLDENAANAVVTMATETHGDSRNTADELAALAALGERELPVASAPAEVAEDAEADGHARQNHGQVYVRVIGDPAVLGPDGEPLAGLRAKAVELLVYLAVQRGGASLSDIMEALWPDAKVGRAAERLSTTVANLRGVLRAAKANTTEDRDAHASAGGSRGRRRNEPIPNTGSRYHLDPSFVNVDWWTVLDEHAQVGTALDDRGRLAHLQAAIAAASAGHSLADGCDYEWIDTDREHVRRQLVRLYAHAADLLSDTDPAAAHSLYLDACRIDPLSEELTRRAMRAAARLNNPESIRARLQDLRHSLAAADIEIGPDIEQLAASLLRDLAGS